MDLAVLLKLNNRAHKLKSRDFLNLKAQGENNARIERLKTSSHSCKGYALSLQEKELAHILHEFENNLYQLLGDRLLKKEEDYTAILSNQLIQLRTEFLKVYTETSFSKPLSFQQNFWIEVYLKSYLLIDSF